MLDALFCVTDPGDEVILTDPTYAGMVNRVRLVGAVPRFAPLLASTENGDLILMRSVTRLPSGPERSSSTTPRSRVAGLLPSTSWRKLPRSAGARRVAGLLRKL